MLTTKASRSDAITEQERRNRQLAYEAAAEGIVLLENDGTLPLRPCPVALFGAGAEYTIKGGSGEVNVRHEVNVLEGLESAGFTVTTKEWIRRYGETWRAGKEAFIRANRKKLLQFSTHVLADLMAAEYRYPSGDRITEADLSGADTCVYVLSRQSGEGHDRRDEAGSFRLDAVEAHNIRFCAQRFNRLVLVINTGAPIDLTPLDGIPGIGAIVYMGQLGMEGGTALADVLTGKRAPSGKLAVTWPKSYEDVPYGGEFSVDGADRAAYREGIYVGYRYYDSFGVEPRYPFGYGKCYTSFDLEAEHTELDGEHAICSVTVTNTGAAAGREVVQLYVSCPQGKLYKEYQRLSAFGKTRLLQPGEKETLRLRFPFSLLSSYDKQHGETCLEPGDYIMRAGTSSRDTKPVCALRLEQRVMLSKHRNLCVAKQPVSELTESRVKNAVRDDLPVLTISPITFRTEVYDYRPAAPAFSDRVQKYLDGFEIEDMARICAGSGLFGENTGFRVPGAVGHTTAAYIEKGIPNVELCDGPAGLRIQRRSTITSKGKIKPVDTAISLYEFLPGFVRKFLLGNPKKEQLLYQYVTGFPVAAMVAQSWNVDLARRIGEAVSAEMSEFGARIWLAPALNIVRNPLCGRNYEYYSEDPLISGKMAAAITDGVQSVPGNCVTIKHFAANNQEGNRYYVSSDLDARTAGDLPEGV